MKFQVWAPNAKQVELVLGDGENRLPACLDEHPARQSSPTAQPQSSGHWTLDLPDAEVPAGTRYCYSLDGANPVPDPRSPWQPDGVHGPSATVDHAAYNWHDQNFQPVPLASAVLYELHVGTFTEVGTYVAAAEKLPHLADLGVTHVELLPIASFPGQQGWGYDGVSLYAPHPAYGTPEELKDFIAAAHERGIAVLLDVVYNHLGPDGNYIGGFGPYFTDRYHTPWGSAVNVDEAGSNEVRSFFIDNALMWLRDYHFDGLRLDAVHAITDKSAVNFFEEMAERVSELEALESRDIVLIAECDLNDPRYVRPHSHGGYGLDAHWCDDFHHALHAFFTGELDGYYADYGSLADVAKALEQAYVFDGQWSPFRQRNHGRPPIDITPGQLVVSAQNHDQIGNRALGERLPAIVNEDALRAIASLLLLSPFVPMLFQGEEWAASTPFQYFTDHVDKNLGRLVTEGRRREFSAFKSHSEDVPDPQDSATFQRSKLDWSELNNSPHAALLDWHKQLIRLRREILDGDNEDISAEVEFDEDARWLTLRRGKLLVICNLADREQIVPTPPGTWETLMAHPAPRELGQPLPAGATLVVTRS